MVAVPRTESRLLEAFETQPLGVVLGKRELDEPSIFTSPSAIFGLNQESRKVMQKRNINVLDVATMSTFPCFQALYEDAVHVGGADQAWYRSVAFSIFERSLHL